MSISGPESHSESIDQLLELYRVLDEQVSRLEKYIWETATLLGIGSAVGLLSIANGSSSIGSNGATIAAVFAISASVIWWRFAKRWWSIQHLKLERMDEIEKRISKRMKLESDTTVPERDVEVMQHIKYLRREGSIGQRIASLQFSIPRSISPKESQEAANYEHRGNQPAGKLLVITNIVLWSMFALLIIQTKRPDIPVIAGAVLTALAGWYLWWKR
jgi:hypothetical protein